MILSRDWHSGIICNEPINNKKYIHHPYLNHDTQHPETTRSTSTMKSKDILKYVLLCPALCKGFSPLKCHIHYYCRTSRNTYAGRSHVSMTSLPSQPESLGDKVYLVTGSTDGIGRHTASRLAEQGSTVLVHGRREASVRNAVDFVKQHSDGKARVEGFVSDISSLQGMHKLCDEVLARTERLDCLINNAGVFEADFRHSADGLEYTFAVNVLAPYVITGRLLDLVAKTPGGGRIVNVASISAASSLDFDNLQFEKGGYSNHASYSLSKLLDIMFNAELARRAPSAVTCNSLDPGTVDTKMLRAGWGYGGTPVSRANDQYFLASSDSVSSSTGNYYVSQRVCNPPVPARSEAACQRLWGVLEDLSGFVYL